MSTRTRMLRPIMATLACIAFPEYAAHAKPPDLPAVPTVTCSAQASQIAEGKNAATGNPSSPAPGDDGANPLTLTIDPTVVESLRNALLAAGEPDRPKLVIVVEDLPANEEQEGNALAQWPLVPPPNDVPSFLLEPPDGDLFAGAEEESSDEPSLATSPEASAFAQQHVNNWLHQISDAVTDGTCVDVDLSARGLRSRCEFEVGGVAIQMSWDGAGHGYFIVKLLPEASDDLRAAQRVFNEKTLDWIESFSATGESIRLYDNDIDDYLGLFDDPADDPWTS